MRRKSGVEVEVEGGKEGDVVAMKNEETNSWQERDPDRTIEQLPRLPRPQLHIQLREISPVHLQSSFLFSSPNTANMAFTLAFKLFLAFLLPLVSALKFEMQAHPGHESASKERCIRNFVAINQLVVVTTTISGSKGDGQTLNMHVSLSSFPSLPFPSHRLQKHPD